MAEDDGIRKTVDSLSSAGLVISGRLFHTDAKSMTVDAGGIHYELPVEYITNRHALADAKIGEAVEVRISPDAKIIEKRLIDLNLPGVTTARTFARATSGASGFAIAACFPFCDCVQCSHCVDCSICSNCISYCSNCLEFVGQTLPQSVRFRSFRG